MNEILTLIWLKHRTKLNEAITAVKEGGDIDDAAVAVLTVLDNDDTFNKYSEGELLFTIADAITLAIE